MLETTFIKNNPFPKLFEGLSFHAKLQNLIKYHYSESYLTLSMKTNEQLEDKMMDINIVEVETSQFE